MNFLAHLWLAERTNTSLAGSILGDVVHGADLSPYPDDIAQGIRLHRRVDAQTDRHPDVRALRERFAPGARRYAGIVLDLAFDHALAGDWSRYSGEPLAVFCDRAGAAIADAAPWFQLAGGRSSSAAEFSQLLRSYGEPAGITRALSRTASRLRKPQALLDAGADWPAHLPQLRERLPDLLQVLQQAMTDEPSP